MYLPCNRSSRKYSESNESISNQSIKSYDHWRCICLYSPVYDNLTISKLQRRDQKLISRACSSQILLLALKILKLNLGIIFLLWKLLHQLPTRNIVSCQHFLLQDPAVKSFNMSVYVILCLCLGKLKDFPDYFETVLIPSMISRDQGTVGQVEERTAEMFALQSWDKRQSGSSGTRHQSLCRQTWRE